MDQPQAPPRPVRRVISASRRTDIPAHYTPWLLERLAAGRCRVFHAMGHRWLEVDLRPEAVAAIVLWSKDLAPLLPHLPAVAAEYAFACHLTITGHGRVLEPGSPPWEEAVRQARAVAALFSPDHLVWRFDPVVLTEVTPAVEVAARFRRLCRALEGATTRCVMSYVCVYGKVRRRLAARAIDLREQSVEERIGLALELQATAREHGMVLSACCTEGLLEAGIPTAHCIDPEQLRLVGARLDAPLRRAPSRPGCGCYASIDIGMYDTCPTGCVFCYANTNDARAAGAPGEHDAAGDALRERP
jgi:hypothetical protein